MLGFVPSFSRNGCHALGSINWSNEIELDYEIQANMPPTRAGITWDLDV